MMTQDEIGKIERRLQAATTGPWELPQGSKGTVFSAVNGRYVANTFGAWSSTEDLIPENQANAEFIAHAQEDITALIAEVRLRNGRIAELEQLLTATDLILDSRTDLLKEIPEYPVHGDECVPHAIEWVRQAKTSGIDFEAQMKQARLAKEQ